MLRPHVGRVLAAIGSVDAAVADIRGGIPRVRVAAFGTAPSSFAPGAGRDLRRSHPDVVIEIVQFETKEAIECLHAGAADMALVHYMPDRGPRGAPRRGGARVRGDRKRRRPRVAEAPERRGHAVNLLARDR